MDMDYYCKLKILDEVLMTQFGLSKTVTVKDIYGNYNKNKIFIPLRSIDMMNFNELLFEFRKDRTYQDILQGLYLNMSSTENLNKLGYRIIDKQMAIHQNSIQEITIQNSGEEIVYYIKLCYFPEFIQYKNEYGKSTRYSRELDRSPLWRKNELENAITSQLLLRISGFIFESNTVNSFKIFASKMQHLFSKSNIRFIYLDCKYEKTMSVNFEEKILSIYYNLK